MRTRGIDVAAELPASPLAALTLALLRHHGIAARYVSGYLFATGSGDGQESVEVDTHAWLEALLPAADGSDPIRVGADPTNRVLAGETHVKIGHGERTDPASIARS